MLKKAKKYGKLMLDYISFLRRSKMDNKKLTADAPEETTKATPKKTATAPLILSIVALALFWWFGVPSLVMSIIALSKIRSCRRTGVADEKEEKKLKTAKTLATVALIGSIVVTVIIALIAVIALIAAILGFLGMLISWIASAIIAVITAVLTFLSPFITTAISTAITAFVTALINSIVEAIINAVFGSVAVAAIL